MFARIRHLATHTERYDAMAKFYGNIFGMKQITTGLMDENSKANAERGHISDGVIGMALLAKRAGSGQGLDHFGFEVEDVRQAVDRIDRFYPELLHTKALAYVPFAGIRAQDPTGVQFDLSQKGQSNVREGYLSDGWEQPRWLNHIALRAREPEKVAEFYTKILELKGVEEAGEAGSMMLTDGKVRLIIRRCHNGFYRTMRQGFRSHRLPSRQRRANHQRVSGSRSSVSRMRREKNRRWCPRLRHCQRSPSLSHRSACLRRSRRCAGGYLRVTARRIASHTSAV